MHRTSQPTRGFTLVEMLVVITIIAILAGMMLAALGGAAESAKVQRAQQQIAKIDQLINEKWNSYRYRQVPVRIPAGTNPQYAARIRLDVLRELMRMEMPDRLTDILDDPVSPKKDFQDPAIVAKGGTIPPQSRPSLSRAYLRRVTAAAQTTASYDQAECLFLILQEMRDGDRSALNFFMSSEIGDLDGDGMNEILDPWGNPIMFVRWAPGYSKYTKDDPELAGQLNSSYPVLEHAVATMQIPLGSFAPDPFDPLRIDPRWSDSTAGALRPFELRPLIYSAGPDKKYDIFMDQVGTLQAHYSKTTIPNDPYVVTDDTGTLLWVGMPYDTDGDSYLGHGDNITNHGLGLQGE